MKLRLTLVSLLLVTTTATAQEHKFWDRPNTRAFVVTAGIRGADIAQTCYHLTAYPGQWQEKWLPVKSCPAIAGMIASGQATQTAAVYFAHTRGWHKLERVLPYIWVAPNVGGIAVSLRFRRP